MSIQGLCYTHKFRPEVGIIPGWPWLEQHEHDLDGWQPEIEMNLRGVRYHIKGADHKVLSQVIKANK